MDSENSSLENEMRALVNILAHKDPNQAFDETYRQFIGWAKDIVVRHTRCNKTRPEVEGQSEQTDKVRVLVDITNELTPEERKEYFNLYIQDAIKLIKPAKESLFGVGDLY